LLNDLTTIQSTPTVLVAHHTNKSAFSSGQNGSTSSFTQATARGSSALVDGVRWVGALQKKSDQDTTRVSFKVVKSNYTAIHEPLELRRDFANGGVLLPCPPEVVKGANPENRI
jgi:hypothetical protein